MRRQVSLNSAGTHRLLRVTIVWCKLVLHRVGAQFSTTLGLGPCLLLKLLMMRVAQGLFFRGVRVVLDLRSVSLKSLALEFLILRHHSKNLLLQLVDLAARSRLGFRF